MGFEVGYLVEEVGLLAVGVQGVEDWVGGGGGEAMEGGGGLLGIGLGLVV